MRHVLPALLLMAIAGPVSAQPASPAATATCKDGSAYTSTVRGGACARHGGVQSWAMPSCTGDKLVWVNSDSHIYFAPGDRWFGKTAQGKYSCQKDADGEGDKASKSNQ